MKKLMTNRNVFENLKGFQSSDPKAVREHNKSVRETVLPALREQLRRKEQGVASRAKNLKVF